MEQVVLDVTYEEKEHAKALGARWNRDKRYWYLTTPAAALRLADYVPEYARLNWPPRYWLPHTYEQRAEAKALGAIWDTEWKSWYLNK